MKLILKAYTKQSELLFELVQDADISIGVLITLESDQGSISGGISFDGSHAIYPAELELLSKTSRLTAHFIVDSDSDVTTEFNSKIEPNVFYIDSGGGIYSDRSFFGQLFVSTMLVQNVNGGISFVSSVVERNEKVNLKYDHYIDEVTDPYIFVDLHFRDSMSPISTPKS